MKEGEERGQKGMRAKVSSTSGSSGKIFSRFFPFAVNLMISCFDRYYDMVPITEIVA